MLNLLNCWTVPKHRLVGLAVYCHPGWHLVGLIRLFTTILGHFDNHPPSLPPTLTPVGNLRCSSNTWITLTPPQKKNLKQWLGPFGASLFINSWILWHYFSHKLWHFLRSDIPVGNPQSNWKSLTGAVKQGVAMGRKTNYHWGSSG